MKKALNTFYILLIGIMLGYGWRIYHETIDRSDIKQSYHYQVFDEVVRNVKSFEFPL